jgi:hypothetical protein
LGVKSLKEISVCHQVVELDVILVTTQQRTLNRERGKALMKATLVVAAFLVLAMGVAHAEDLKKLSLDDASAVTPKIETDAKVKVEGASSIRITTKWPTVVCLGEVAGLDVEDTQLMYSAKVRSELEGKGTAFLEMWVQIGEGQYFSKGMNDVVSQKSDWKTIRTPFNFQKGQRPDKVTLNLVINGSGTVWIDDIVLARKSPKKDRKPSR